MTYCLEGSGDTELTIRLHTCNHNCDRKRKCLLEGNDSLFKSINFYFTNHQNTKVTRIPKHHHTKYPPPIPITLNTATKNVVQEIPLFLFHVVAKVSPYDSRIQPNKNQRKPKEPKICDRKRNFSRLRGVSGECKEGG